MGSCQSKSNKSIVNSSSSSAISSNVKKSNAPDLDIGQLTPQVSSSYPTPTNPNRPGEITHQLSTNSTTSNRKTLYTTVLRTASITYNYNFIPILKHCH
jgi:hypothetical protein